MVDNLDFVQGKNFFNCNFTLSYKNLGNKILKSKVNSITIIKYNFLVIFKFFM